MRDNEIMLNVERVVNKGYGMGRDSDGKIVFVEGAYPGEIVIAKVEKEKRDLIFAKTIEVVKPSPHRRVPKCPVFGKCGGCQFMDIDYKEQLKIKEEIVRDIFQRFLKMDSSFKEIVPSDIEYGYRTKIETTAFWKGEAFIGMRMKGSHKIIPIEECLLAPDKVNSLIREIPKLLTALDVPIYNFFKRKGVLKHVVFRYAFSTDQTMLIFVTKTESFKWGRMLSKLVLKKFPWIHSIIHVMNSKDSVVLRGPYRTLYGEGIIVEKYDWEDFQIPPTAFFQSNYFVSRKLADVLFDSLNLSGKEVVLDLYSGVGLFSLRISSAAKKVIGVESSRVSVKAAKANANINDRRNAFFVESDAIEFLKSYEKRADIIVLDPPRSGAGKEVMKEIIRISPNKIAYISCEPSTLVRDIKVLIDGGYSVEFVQPFDMFPQTFHVETLTLLKKVI